MVHEGSSPRTCELSGLAQPNLRAIAVTNRSLDPAYGFSVVWRSVKPNRCIFVQSRTYKETKSRRLVGSAHPTVGYSA